MTTRIRVETPDDLIAAVPHLLGFRVENSVVVVPAQGSPIARVDMPIDQAEREQMVENLVPAYARNGVTGGMIILAYNDDSTPVKADLATRALGEAMTQAGLPVTTRLWVQEHRWTDLAPATT